MAESTHMEENNSVDTFTTPILIVDDSDHIRILLKRSLKSAGFLNILTAENGLIGLELIKTARPSIIFLDGIMPEMDGLSVLQEAKKINPDIIVVMTTSLSSKEIVLKYKEAGADLYLLKPFEETKFNETVNKVTSLFNQRKLEGKL